MKLPSLDQLTRSLGMLIGLLLAVTACVPASGPSAQQTPGATQVKPVTGGTLRLAMALSVSPLDPIRATGVGEPARLSLYETLYFAMPGGGTEPGLAESTIVAPDGLTWTLTLRKGVRFHDGTPFDAEAVKWNLQARKDFSGFTGRGQIASISQIDVVDSTTVRLRLVRATPALKVIFGSNLFGIVSPTAWKKYPDAGDYMRHAAGTGPFKLEGTPLIEEFTLVRNDEYWGPKPYLDRLVFREVPDPATRRAVLEAGDVDAVEGMSEVDYQSIVDSGKFTVTESPTAESQLYAYFNFASDLMSDRRVREAIAYGLDRASYVKLAYGLGKVGNSVMPPAYVGVKAFAPYPYDPERAKKLLADAGVPQGKQLDLIALIGQVDARPYAELVKQDLDRLGFRTTLRSLPAAGWLEQMTALAPESGSRWQISLGTQAAPYFDAEAQLYRFFDSAVRPPKGSNWQHYKNDRVDALLAQQSSTVDEAQRARLLGEIQTEIWNDIAGTPVIQIGRFFVTSKRVHGIEVLGVVPIQMRFGKAWIEAP